jgi:hypothetical protein
VQTRIDLGGTLSGSSSVWNFFFKQLMRSEPLETVVQIIERATGRDAIE